MEKKKKRPTSNCESCVHYDYDEYMDAHICTVTLDEDEYVLSAGFLSLKAARREPFRIVDEDGEAEQAILAVDKKGRASLIFRAKEVAAEQ